MDFSQPGAGLALASLAASLAYGLVLVGRPPTALRMAIKTAAVGLIAVVAWLADAPWLLVAALVFSALGDAFMADPDRFLPLGLGSFLLAHVLYTPLFLQYREVAVEPERLAAIALVVVAALVMLRWLWPGLGRLKGAVIAYVAAIASMVSTSFLLPAAMWPAMAGALAFMASDALLAGQLFRKAQLAGTQKATDLAVWFLYYGAQALIAWAFLA